MKSMLVALSLLICPAVASARLLPPEMNFPAWGAQPNNAKNRGENTTATLEVKGPIKLRVKTVAGDVEIVAGQGRQITAQLSDGDAGGVTFREGGGDRIEVLFDGDPSLRCGKLGLTVPKGSEVDVWTNSGDVTVKAVSGNVRIRSVAGDVHVTRAQNVELRTISGDVIAEEIAGEVRIETVSGDTRITASKGSTSPRLAFNTTSGDLVWSGSCGPGCKLEARSLSGDLQLKLDPLSSFDVHYLSHSGEVNDDFKLEYAGPRPPSHEVNVRARYKAGDGLVECQTFSGDLRLLQASR
jgi:hypothetical protein